MGLTMTYDHRVPAFHPLSWFDGKDEATLYLPMDYVTITSPDFTKGNTRIFISLNYSSDEFEYLLDNWFYEIRKVGDEKMVIFNFVIDDPIDTGLYIPEDVVPNLRIRFESDNVLFTDKIPTYVDYPKELLKGFKVSTYELE